MIRKSFDQIKRKETNGPAAAVIRYDRERDDLPTVVAHGKGHIAEQIIQLAKKHHVPLQEDPILVENLIDMDLGENIPPQLYGVIAEILLMIEEIEKKL
jgi:flagellar biosynthesis protein